MPTARNWFGFWCVSGCPDGPTLTFVRSLDVIDSELRLLVAVRRAAVEDGGTAPSLHLIDGLLDERRAVNDSGDSSPSATRTLRTPSGVSFPRSRPGGA